MSVTSNHIFNYMLTMNSNRLMHLTFIYQSPLPTTILQRLQLNSASTTATQE